LRYLAQSRAMKLSLSALALLAATAALGAASFATFNAQTTNAANVAGTGSMTMTNVAGTAVGGSNCTTATNAGTCAVLFTAGSTTLTPGAADKTNTVAITYAGSITTATFGLHAANYTSKAAGSASYCSAVAPGSKVNLQVKQGSTIIYPTSGSGYGTLDGFASSYTGTGALLHLKGGTSGSGVADVWASSDSSTFTVNLNLDSTADNPYQGCQSQFDLVWYAAQ
jgi:hypothetical protein